VSVSFLRPRARGFAATIASAGAAILSGCAHPAAMLPPAVAPQFSVYHFAGLAEPPLWPPEALRGYRTRIRLSISGILLLKGAIAIDELATGALRGRVVTVDRDERGEPVDRTVRTFRVTRAAFDSLQASIARTRLWHLYPEFWTLAEGEICLDGMDLVFERVDARGYRFSTANAQCTAPADIIEVAEQMIEMSGDRTMLRWLH
jgi:hypothetical protein